MQRKTGSFKEALKVIFCFAVKWDERGAIVLSLLAYGGIRNLSAFKHLVSKYYYCY